MKIAKILLTAGLFSLSATPNAATVQLSIGSTHAMAVNSDGSLWAWGSNTYGVIAQPSTVAQQNTPIQISTGFSKVSSGTQHTLAIKQDGTLWAWGGNSFGQLGEGQRVIMSSTPIQIGTGYSQVSASSEHSLAIKTDGSLWAWGNTYSGQIGNGQAGNSIYQTTPIQIGTNFIKIVAAPGYSLGIKSDGTLWGWGNDFYGQFGRGDVYTTPTTPIQINSNVADVAASAGHTLIVKKDGSLWTWGYNFSGQLGVGTTGGQSRIPLKVGDGFTKVATASSASFAIKADGTLWSWGDNQYASLGNGKVGFSNLSNIPVQIGSGYSSLSSGSLTIGAIKNDGSVWMWGMPGTSGTNQSSALTTPTQINIGTPPPVQFNATGTAQGNIFSATLSAATTISSTDLSNNSPGTMYIIAVAPNGVILTYTPAGWQLLNINNPIGWSNTLQNKTGIILSNENLSSIRGLAIFAGYGLGNNALASLNELLNSQRYKLIFIAQ